MQAQTDGAISLESPLRCAIMELTMKVQEVKPEGRRRIGKLSLRAAHNVHEVDVCACSLHIEIAAWIVFGEASFDLVA